MGCALQVLQYTNMVIRPGTYEALQVIEYLPLGFDSGKPLNNK